MFRVLVVFAVIICALYGLQVWAADTEAPTILTQVHIPRELWFVIIGGAVQGLIWYGAVNSKITALTERITHIERRAIEDRAIFEKRAETDRHAQADQYSNLLKVFINSMQKGN